MSKTARIQCIAFSTFLAAAIIFIIVAFGTEMMNTKASTTIVTTTIDNEAIEIIILTDTPYSKKEWKRIEQSVKTVAKRSNYKELSSNIYDMMETKNWSVLTIMATKMVYKIK